MNILRKDVRYRNVSHRTTKGRQQEEDYLALQQAKEKQNKNLYLKVVYNYNKIKPLEI